MDNHGTTIIASPSIIYLFHLSSADPSLGWGKFLDQHFLGVALCPDIAAQSERFQGLLRVGYTMAHPEAFSPNRNLSGVSQGLHDRAA